MGSRLGGAGYTGTEQDRYSWVDTMPEAGLAVIQAIGRMYNN